MDSSVPNNLFSANPYASLASDGTPVHGRVGAQLRRRALTKKRAHLAIDRRDSGLTDLAQDENHEDNDQDDDNNEVDDDDDDNDDDDNNNYNMGNVNSIFLDKDLDEQDGDDEVELDTTHVSDDFGVQSASNSDEDAQASVIKHDHLIQEDKGALPDLIKHDSVVAEEEDRQTEESILAQVLEPAVIEDHDSVSKEYRPDTIDALVTAMTTPTTPPPVMMIMHGGFAVLIVVLGALAIYTWGMPGNWVVWFLFAVNVPLWGLVTKLASTIGSDEYETMDQESENDMESDGKESADEDEDEDDHHKDLLLLPGLSRKVSKKELATLQRIASMVTDVGDAREEEQDV